MTLLRNCQEIQELCMSMMEVNWVSGMLRSGRKKGERGNHFCRRCKSMGDQYLMDQARRTRQLAQAGMLHLCGKDVSCTFDLTNRGSARSH